MKKTYCDMLGDGLEKGHTEFVSVGSVPKMRIAQHIEMINLGKVVELRIVPGSADPTLCILAEDIERCNTDKEFADYFEFLLYDILEEKGAETCEAVFREE